MTNAEIERQLDSLKESLKSAKETILQQQQALEELSASPLSHGVIVESYTRPNAGGKNKNMSLISTGTSIVEVINSISGCKPGDPILVNGNGAIVGKAHSSVGGDVVFFKREIDNIFIEVETHSGVRQVFKGSAGINAEKGDRLVLDQGNFIVIQNLKRGEERFRFEENTGVSWDDIGGLKMAKNQMLEAVELPYKNPEVFKYYGKRPTKGILLYGPPGCGKTMLGKAAATSIANTYKSKTTSAFMYVKGPEILDKYVGVAEATIRSLFAAAKDHKNRYNFPAVIFIDEAEAVLSRRGSGISSDIERTIVPMFLTEMDGLQESGALIILATNRPDILDPAIIRDGRIDNKIRVTRPDQTSTEDILRLTLEGKPVKDDVCKMINESVKQLFSPKRVLYQIRTKSHGELTFPLSAIVSGGMVVNLINIAITMAMRRDFQNNKKSGIKTEDVMAAIEEIELQHRDLNHTDDIKDFIHDFKEDVIEIRKLKNQNK